MPGPGRRRGAGLGLAAQGDRDDHPGPAVGHGRHGRQLGRCPLRLRHSRTARRYRLRHRGHGRVRLRRNHDQPGAEGKPRRHHRQDRHAVPEQAGIQGSRPRRAAWYGPGFGTGYPAGRWRRAVVVCVLHAGKEDLEESGTLRQGPPGRPGWSGIGEQRRRPDFVHPAADAGHPG
ncbi:hypothetical protein D3C85_1255370 [compost metagenome]